MRHPRFNIAIFVLGTLMTHSVKAQNQVTVTSKPFQITSSTTVYDHLSTRLPQLICSGIVYNSDLQFDPLGFAKPAEFKNLTTYTLEKDSIYQAAKGLLASRKIQFMLDGEMHVINDEFYITVYGTDFKQPLIPFRSTIRPIAQIQNVIDEASANISYQVRSRLTGKPSYTIQILPFAFESTGKQGAFPKELYDADFPARFIAYNLRDSKLYSVLPYDNAKSSQNRTQHVLPQENVATIGGTVSVDGRGTLVISPVLTWKTESLELLETKGPLRTKDKLLEKNLSVIQSMLDAIISAGGLTAFNEKVQSYSENNMRVAFESALSENNIAMANYYAERIGRKNVKQMNLYKAKLYFKANDLNAALVYSRLYLKEDSTSEAANYISALINIKMSKYEEAKSNLKKVRVDSPDFMDVLFQQGVCYYNQDSIQKAVRLFLGQKKVNDKTNPELYAYIGFCYQWLAMWDEAEKNFIKLYEMDKANVSNRNYVLNFYNKAALTLLRSADYQKAYEYYMKSYEKSKRHGSLFGAIESNLKMKTEDGTIEGLINTGIKDSVFVPKSI
jgi:tetratricopeptide (TPR) repeat protein